MDPRFPHTPHSTNSLLTDIINACTTPLELNQLALMFEVSGKKELAYLRGSFDKRRVPLIHALNEKRG